MNCQKRDASQTACDYIRIFCQQRLLYAPAYSVRQLENCVNVNVVVFAVIVALFLLHQFACSFFQLLFCFSLFALCLLPARVDVIFLKRAFLASHFVAIVSAINVKQVMFVPLPAMSESEELT